MSSLPSGSAKSAIRRVGRRLVALEVVDRAMALAGQAFAALLPFMILLGSASRAEGRDVADTLIERFELSGDAARTLRDAVAPRTDVRSATTVLGAILLVVAATAFARALQRLYARVWDVETLGWRGAIWALGWLAAFCVYWSLLPVIAGVTDGALATVLSLGLATCLWLFTPWLLLARRLPLRQLLPQALLTAVGIAALLTASAIYLPEAMGDSGRQFGFIGAAFVLLSWLYAAGLVVVIAAVVGAAIVQPARRRAETR